MKSLILAAHGSRREASNDEVRALALRLGDKAVPPFGEVAAAFLELTKPSIDEAIVAAVDRGAEAVVVLPYLLAAGRHVVTDIPEQVDKARAARPYADIQVRPYLGSADALVEVLLGIAES